MLAESLYGYGRLERTLDARDYTLSPFLPDNWHEALWRWQRSQRSREWCTGPMLDQVRTNHCGGFEYIDFQNCKPIRPVQYLGNADGHAAYYAIVANAGYPGSENGVEMRWIVDYALKTGRIGGYAWAGSLDEIRYWLAFHSNVMVGTWWTSSMEEPDVNGLILPTGIKRGGHAYGLVGWDAETDLVKIMNHWSELWGPKKGYAYMPMERFGELLADGGEVIMTLEKPR